MIILEGKEREECKRLRDTWYARRVDGKISPDDRVLAYKFMKELCEKRGIKLPEVLNPNEYSFHLNCGIIFLPTDDRRHNHG